MKNKILAIFKVSIPFVPALLPLAHKPLACMLMQQLDFWFMQNPGGFYKFLSAVPPKRNSVSGLEEKGHPLYVNGDSWCEEIAFTEDQFRSAFDQIGTRYSSLGEYRAAVEAGDVYKGKFYVSYVDRQTNLTHYFRNHAILDQALEDLAAGKYEPKPNKLKKPSPEIDPKLDAGNGDTNQFVDEKIDSGKSKSENPSPEVGNDIHRNGTNPSPLTEITSEKTSKSSLSLGGHEDPQTKMWIQNSKDEKLMNALIKKYELESIVFCSERIELAKGTAWPSFVAVELKLNGKIKKMAETVVHLAPAPEDQKRRAARFFFESLTEPEKQELVQEFKRTLNSLLQTQYRKSGLDGTQCLQKEFTNFLANQSRESRFFAVKQSLLRSSNCEQYGSKLSF